VSGVRRLRVNGSHHGKEGSIALLSAPIHANAPLKAGLLRHLMRLAGLSGDDFWEAA
jgi:predicted RNA binding protein YcfA (HicA-like mRNA interferase family)